MIMYLNDMEKISEEEIKKNWPSAVEGSIEHPELGVVHYWTGEQHGKIVVRFSYDSQAEGEFEKMFFIDLTKNSWELSHISTFESHNSKLKLLKIHSFKDQDELEKKYRSIIELFIKSRNSAKMFYCFLSCICFSEKNG